MAEPTRSYFETISSLVQNAFDSISLKRLDFNPYRSIWEVHGSLGESDIRLKEIFTQSGPMYSYYVIREDDVIAGFDNYPDTRMLN